MALNIKNRHVERLAGEVSELTGESKTQAIGKALEERKQRLLYKVTESDRRAQLARFMQAEIWPKIPKSLLGRKMSRKEEAKILGYGPKGV
jgi:antitoxin VapB